MRMCVLAAVFAAILVLLAPFAAAAPDDEPFGMFVPEMGMTQAGDPNPAFHAAQDVGIQSAQTLGMRAGWQDIETTFTTPPTYNWSIIDSLSAGVPTSITRVGAIAVNGTWGAAPTRNVPGSYLPIDQTRYTSFVLALVERFDGDGINDASSLTQPIKYWQVDGEVGDDIAPDYDQLLRITYPAAKQADPQAKIISGAWRRSPIYGYSASGTIADFDLKNKPILDRLGGQYMDIMDIHWFTYFNGDYRLKDPLVSTEDFIGHVRAKLTGAGFSPDLPIWMIEVGAVSGSPRRGAERNLSPGGGNRKRERRGRQGGPRGPQGPHGP
jgi:hypothetical protein